MIIAQVKSPTSEDRYFPLEAGVYSLGSDLACDLILLEKSILARHATLHVGDKTVEVEIAEHARGVISRFFPKRTLKMAAGERRPLFLGDKLQIGDLFMQVEGVDLERANRKSRRAKRQFSLSLLSSGVFFIGVFFSPSASAPYYAPPPLSREHPAEQRKPQPDASRSIEENVRALGVKPESLQQEPDNRWKAVFRVATAQQRVALEKKISATIPSLDARIFADDELSDAAKLVLANLPGQAQVLSAAHGVLTLQLRQGDQKLQETLAHQLSEDIPGVVNVRFGGDADADADVKDIRASIVAVWLGNPPYVKLAGNKIVRPGEPLTPKGPKLISITADRLRVQIDGTIKEVPLND
ncbi:hypothetical protein [Brucella sp. IR073]|uniref:hypothetical protein n=1 Tax=unclassified Brucella TaxID=2632610 RepID=UPI003B9820C4